MINVLVKNGTVLCSKSITEKKSFLDIHFKKGLGYGIRIDCGTEDGDLLTNEIRFIVVNKAVFDFHTASGSIYRAMAENMMEWEYLQEIKSCIEEHNIPKFSMRNQQAMSNYELVSPEDFSSLLIQEGLFQGYYADGRLCQHFLQWNSSTASTMPNQGVKLHIAVKNYQDYVFTLKTLIPIMKSCEMTFKVVNPMSYSHFERNVSSQQGKYITIYPCNCDFNRFLKEASSILADSINVIPLLGDACIFGRLFGRYGAMRGRYVYDASGNAYNDDRSKAYPDFIESIALEDFLVR